MESENLGLVMLQLLHRCVGLFAISYEAWAVNLCLRAKLSLHIGSALIINSLILFFARYGSWRNLPSRPVSFADDQISLRSRFYKEGE